MTSWMQSIVEKWEQTHLRSGTVKNMDMLCRMIKYDDNAVCTCIFPAVWLGRLAQCCLLLLKQYITIT